MNPLSGRTCERANEAAIYNLYLCLAHKTTPANHEPLRAIIDGLETAVRNQPSSAWSTRDIYRLQILRNAVNRHPILAKSRIGDLTRSTQGLNACSFTNPYGDVFVVFRGTGKGEWLDNGEGLSGIPEENTYITYSKTGDVVSEVTIPSDYATDQQVEALNWFHYIATRNGWNEQSKITLSGHSKGGNKAQFVAIHSDLVDACYSFDGQGFSPEALTALRNHYGATFTARRRNILSFSTDNDYVNVLGQRLMPESQIFYFNSSVGFHYMEAMLDINGRFNPQCDQGRLSKYVESVSDELMRMDPSIRQYATLGIMNVFQTYLGSGIPVNGDTVSMEKTIAGIGVAIGPLLHHLGKLNFS